MPEPERIPADGGPAADETPLGRTDGSAEGLAALLESLAAIGHSMQEEFDPQRFLGEFSVRLQRLVPHDRLVVDLLDEDGRTFTVFAEHAPTPLTLHQEHYTTAFHPGTRYVVAEWVLRRVFAGEPLLVGDFPEDPRFEALNPFERRLQEIGIRSGLLVPLESGGRTVGALVATALASHAYGERHLVALRRVAGLIGPFIENVVCCSGSGGGGGACGRWRASPPPWGPAWTSGASSAGWSTRSGRSWTSRWGGSPCSRGAAASWRRWPRWTTTPSA